MIPSSKKIRKDWVLITRKLCAGISEPLNDCTWLDIHWYKDRLEGLPCPEYLFDYLDSQNISTN